MEGSILVYYHQKSWRIRKRFPGLQTNRQAITRILHNSSPSYSRKDLNPIVQIEGGFSMSLSSIIESLREREGGLAGSFKRQFIISFLSHYVKTIAFCKRCSFGIIKKFNLQNMVTYVIFLHSALCEVLISKDTSSHKTLVWSMELYFFNLLVNCLSYQKVQTYSKKCHLQ